jgi:hypothetical protein
LAGIHHLQNRFLERDDVAFLGVKRCLDCALEFGDIGAQWLDDLLQSALLRFGEFAPRDAEKAIGDVLEFGCEP